MNDAWARIARIAARSHGVFTRQEALAAGLTRHELDHALASGRYEHLFESVYAHAGVPRTLEMQQASACKWAGEKAALSHRSSLAEYGLAEVKAERIELTSAGRRCKSVLYLVHRTDYLPAHHLRRRDGRQFTDVARTLFDAGAVVRKRTVRAAVTEAMQRKLTSRKELLGRLVEHGGRGRRGCGVLRQVLKEIDPLIDKGESALEALMVTNVWSGDLPRPEVQYRLRVNGRGYRLDFAYPRIKLGIEADSIREHGGPGGFDRDRVRDDELAAAGWLVLRFTWRQVHNEPEWVIGIIRETIASRTQLFFGS